ncbi:3-hydroxyacyl-CoA dehydrogenase NAD-binding domain-containing protein [Streptomyces olindensis]|uniref:3-hydroxyacyl-CoA dehydrogenase NAD-binding domain-containing protein n=1 Tax=Streptomyces olindensis TaxID=358823 RepID=A0ABV2XS12_9ACTN
MAATGPLVRWGRIRGVTRLDGAADRDRLFETTAEDETATVCPFQRLDAIAHSPRAVLASSASSIPIMKPAVATSEPATGSRSCCARPGRSSRVSPRPKTSTWEGAWLRTSAASREVPIESDSL